MLGEVKQASKIPLLVSISNFLLGVLCIGLAFWLESRDFFIFGYVFTPVGSFLCVAWDSLSQRKGSRDLWFAVNKKLSFSVRALAILSILPALFHIWNISNWIGELAIQGGWFS
jgi:hypothetical protein